MRIICLAAPFRWDRAALNAGEVVSLPDALAEQLVAGGQARFVEPETQAKSLEGPVVDKLMRPKHKKYCAHGSRQS